MSKRANRPPGATGRSSDDSSGTQAMSSPNPMTREELLESAALDAFGLLDEYEAALYTRSFHHAPAAIQREIIEKQAELVSDETFLPIETPDPSLRNRVLDAVAVAIEHDTADLEPLATIGRGGRPPIVDPVPRTPMAYSGQLWRAAAFVMLACLVVVLYFLADVAHQYNTIARLALINNTHAQLEDHIGPTAKEFICDRTERIVFDPNTAVDAHASLFIKEASGQALLITYGLPASSSPYILKIKDRKTGEVEEVQRFVYNDGRVAGIKVALSGIATRIQNAVWQITDETGTVVLASI